MVLPLKFWVSLICILLLFSACSGDTAYQKNSVGAHVGDLVDTKNTWRGGAIGAALGKPVEGKITEITIRASQEAARERRPTAYVSLDGFQRVETYPVAAGSQPHCRKVRERIFQDGSLFRDEVKEVCP